MATYIQDFAGNISNIKDFASLRDYLERQDDRLRYMFENLTPEDNFSAKALEEYQKKGN